MPDKTCPHGEQFVACDQCDEDERRNERAEIETPLDYYVDGTTYCGTCGKPVSLGHQCK